ncbi:MAG TPA: GFA family protein [Gaiellaceae bacterium]|nr:GFA family protein [Gaiellaceae bacterium]
MYTGHCMCGGVRFEVTERPLSAGYCHCTRCQRRTGTAASAQARLAPGSFRLLAGAELVKTYTPEDGWAKSFCSNCGSALWSHSPETGEVGSVRIGLFDPPHDIRPEWHTFVTYACEWEPMRDDGLERYPEAKSR